MKKLKNKQKLERLHEKERKEKAKIIEFQSEKKKNQKKSLKKSLKKSNKKNQNYQK